MASLLLFDLDGCLVDSTVPITTCMNHALEQVDLPVREPADLIRFIGPPLPASFLTMLAEAGIADHAREELMGRCVDAYRDRYPSESVRSTAVIEGIEPALDLLGEHARLAVVTSKPWEFAEPILRGVGLRPRFEAVFGPDTDLQAEPKAATLSRALEKLAPADDPGEAVMIGDREHDVLAGAACGTRTVGVTWGAGQRAELEAAGADHIVSAPADLVEHLAPAGPQPRTG